MLKVLSRVKKYIRDLLRTDREYNDYIITFSTIAIGILSTFIFYITLNVKISLIGFITDMVFICFILLFLNLIKRSKLKKTAFIIYVAFAFFALLADSTYYFQYKSFASITSLMFASNVVGQRYGINLPITCWLLIPLLVINLFIISYTKLSKEYQPTRKKSNIALMLSFMILVSGLTIPNAVYNLSKTSKYSKYDPEYIHSTSYLYNNLYSSAKFVERFGYFNFRLRDATFGSDQNNFQSEELLRNYFNTREVNKGINEYTLKYKDYNLVTILGETFDERFSDPVFLGQQLTRDNSLYIDKDADLKAEEVGHILTSRITPNLYKIRQEAITFDNYYVPTFFEGATINTEFMAGNGIYALNSKNFSSNLGDTYYNNNFRSYSLAGQLKKNNYSTYYVHNDSGDFYNRRTLTQNQGFENVYFDEELEAAGTKRQKIYDTRLLEFFNIPDFDSKLNNNIRKGEKFYIHFDTYSMHMGWDWKFDNPNNVETEKSPLEIVKKAFADAGIDYNHRNLTQIRTYYLKLHEFDAFLGLLLDELNNRRVLDKTLILLYPDHYNYGLNPKEYKAFLDLDAFDKEIHLQKLFLIDGAKYTTKQSDAVNISTLSCTIDITPTLLNMLVGLNADYKYYFGKDIFDKGEKIVSFSDLTVFDGQMFLYADGTYKVVDKNLTDEDAIEAKYIQLTEHQKERIKQYDICKAMLELNFYQYLLDYPNGQR